MSINISNDVKNFGNAPAIQNGNFADRPNFGINGRLYFSVDTQQVFIDTGSSWVIVVAGTGGGGGGYSVSPNYYALANAFGVLNNGSITENATTIAINGLGKQIFIDSDTNFTVDVIGDKASSCNNEEKIINDTLVYSALYANIDGVYAILLQSSLASVNVLAQQDITVEANDGVLISGKNGPVVIKTIAGFSQDIELNSNNTIYVYALESIETIAGLKEITANSLGFYSNSSIDLSSGTPISLTSDNGSINLYANDANADIIIQAGNTIELNSFFLNQTAINIFLNGTATATILGYYTTNIEAQVGAVNITGQNCPVNIKTLPTSLADINIESDGQIYIDTNNQLSLFGAPITLDSNASIDIVANNNIQIASEFGSVLLQTSYGGISINNNSPFSNLTMYSASQFVMTTQNSINLTALFSNINLQTNNGIIYLYSAGFMGGIQLTSETSLGLTAQNNIPIISNNGNVNINAFNNVEITGNSRVDISAGFDAVYIFGVKGMVIPKKYNADILAITSPIVGSMIFNIDLDCPVFYNTSGWQQINYSPM